MLTEPEHPRYSGLGATDVTAFLPSHRSWGKERRQWPAVLFVLDIKKAPKPTPALPKQVPLWYRGGKLVLDRNSKPMRDFPTTLPSTCSSELEGWLLVAMFHTDTRIQIGDVHARMPHEVMLDGNKGKIPLFQVNTISMRMTRFRLEAGLLPREKRCGSRALELGLKELLGDQCFNENSTRSFGRDLTVEEIAGVREPNKGKFLQKSKNKNKGLAAGESNLTTAASNKRKRINTEEPSLSESKVAKKVHLTQLGEGAELQNLGTGLPNLSVGPISPGLPISNYAGSYTGTQIGFPGREAGTGMAGPPIGVTAAGNYHQESNPQFLARMFPNLFPAARETNTYIDTFGTELGFSLDGHSTPYGEPSESTEAFLARVLPNETLSQGTGASVEMLNPRSAEFDTAYQPRENMYSSPVSFQLNNAITSHTVMGWTAQPAAMNQLSSTMENRHVKGAYEVGAYKQGYPPQGTNQRPLSTSHELLPVPIIHGLVDDVAFTPTDQQASTSDFNTRDFTSGKRSRRRGSRINSSRATASGKRSNRQNTSTTSISASATGMRSNHDHAPNTIPRALASGIQSNNQNDFSSNPNASAYDTPQLSYPDPSEFEMAISNIESFEQHSTAHHTATGPYFTPSSMVQCSTTAGPYDEAVLAGEQELNHYPNTGPPGFDELYTGIALPDLGPYEHNETVFHPTPGPYFAQSPTVPSPLAENQQNVADLAGEEELGQNPHTQNQPALPTEEFQLDANLAAELGLSYDFQESEFFDDYSLLAAESAAPAPRTPEGNEDLLRFNEYIEAEMSEMNPEWDLIE